MAEDEDRREEVGQAAHELSVSNVGSTVILQMIADQLSALVFGRSSISQKISNMKMKEKRQPILPKKLKKRRCC